MSLEKLENQLLKKCLDMKAIIETENFVESDRKVLENVQTNISMVRTKYTGEEIDMYKCIVSGIMDWSFGGQLDYIENPTQEDYEIYSPEGYYGENWITSIMKWSDNCIALIDTF